LVDRPATFSPESYRARAAPTGAHTTRRYRKQRPSRTSSPSRI
jgi:hypothetical protein